MIFFKKGYYPSKLLCRYTTTKWCIRKKNRHLLEVARALFSLEIYLNTSGGCYFNCLLNKSVTIRVLKFKTPISTLQECFPKSHVFSELPLRIFGCSVFVHIHNHLRSKLDPRSHKCVFLLGTLPQKKGYMCHSPSKRKYFISRDVTFFEHQSFYSNSSTQGVSE